MGGYLVWVVMVGISGLAVRVASGVIDGAEVAKGRVEAH